MNASGISTTRLQLVPKTVEDARAMVEAMKPEERAQLSPDWLARINASTPADQWTLGYTMLSKEDGAVVGQCGFKGKPDPDGMVEIAYGMAPDHQGKGYATEAAGGLVTLAFGSGQVRVIRAHTVEAANASTRVLIKCGFLCTGQVDDPEDGLVWRWENRNGPK